MPQVEVGTNVGKSNSSISTGMRKVGSLETDNTATGAGAKRYVKARYNERNDLGDNNLSARIEELEESTSSKYSKEDTH